MKFLILLILLSSYNKKQNYILLYYVGDFYTFSTISDDPYNRHLHDRCGVGFLKTHTNQEIDQFKHFSVTKKIKMSWAVSLNWKNSIF